MRRTIRELLRKATKLAKLLPVPAYRRALRHGVAAAIEHRSILEYAETLGVEFMVDAGANIGQFSLVARHVLPDARILAFEPIPSVAERYRHLFAGDGMTELLESALGASCERRPMHVSKAVDSSSLLPIGAAQSTLFPETDESHLEPVSVATLIQFIEAIDLEKRAMLKIDVQGFELEVLKGCGDLLERFVAVYVECSFLPFYEGQPLAYEVADWLRARNFHLDRIGPVVLDDSGLSVQADLLFLNHALADRRGRRGVEDGTTCR